MYIEIIKYNSVNSLNINETIKFSLRTKKEYKHITGLFVTGLQNVFWTVTNNNKIIIQDCLLSFFQQLTSSDIYKNFLPLNIIANGSMLDFEFQNRHNTSQIINVEIVLIYDNKPNNDFYYSCRRVEIPAFNNATDTFYIPITETLEKLEFLEKVAVPSSFSLQINDIILYEKISVTNFKFLITSHKFLYLEKSNAKIQITFYNDLAGDQEIRILMQKRNRNVSHQEPYSKN